MTVPPLPANLASKCDTLTELENGDSATILKWFPKNVPKMHDCSDKHQGVVDAYNNLRNLLNTVNTSN